MTRRFAEALVDPATGEDPRRELAQQLEAYGVHVDDGAGLTVEQLRALLDIITAPQRAVEMATPASFSEAARRRVVAEGVAAARRVIRKFSEARGGAPMSPARRRELLGHTQLGKKILADESRRGA